MSKAIELNDSNFDSEVLNSKLPVLVDFYAPWCGSCRNQIPIIGEVAESLDGKVKVNDEVETRRGRKIYPEYKVEIFNKIYIVE